MGADALSCNLVTDISTISDIEVVVSIINSIQQTGITTLLCTPPSINISGSGFREQGKDPKLKALIDYLEKDTTCGEEDARRVAARALNLTKHFIC